MNLLFWNLYNKSNEKLIADLIKENQIDIAVFAEYGNTNFQVLLDFIGDDFKQNQGIYGSERVALLHRTGYKVNIRRPQDRYLLYSVETDERQYLLAGIHLPSRLHSKTEDRLEVIYDLVRDVAEQERLLQHSNTIIIGDFNASPFDKELILKTGFNAVLFKDIIIRNENIRYRNKMYKRFYNPMLQVFSEDSKDYGSYYRGTEIDSLYWYSFDQVIVRKSLMNHVKKVQYCKRVRHKSLMNSVAPKENISDHLPLIVTFSGGM